MTSIRDKYKATDTSILKKKKEEEDANLSSGRGSDFLTVEDGLNKFRIFPKHEGEEAFSILRNYHWVSYEKDGEIKRTNVPDSRTHAGTEKDIIDEYIKLARLTLDASDADDAKKLKDMVSFPNGLHMSTTWLAYANKIIGKDKAPQFGLLELKKTVRDGMNELSIIEDESEAIEMDPFTDPDEGLPLLITYNSKAKKAADYYLVQLSKKPVPLTEEELERFDKIQPLSKINLLQYTIVQFETAVEGLRIYDEENEIGIFEGEVFQDIIEEVKGQYDQSAGRDAEEETKTTKKTVAKTTTKPTTKTTKKVVVEADEEDEETPFVEDEETEEEPEEAVEADEYEEMDRESLKRAIKALDPEAKFMKSESDDDFRVRVRELAAGGDEGEEGEEEAEEVEAPKTAKKAAAPVKTATAATGGAKLSLADIKAKLNKSKK